MNHDLQCSGKVVMLTGATGTIGEAVAGKLARMGAKLRLVCLNRNKADRHVAEQAVARLIHESSNRDIRALYADLSSLKDIRRMVDRYQSEMDEPLHVLINNAGLFGLNRRILSVDGYELTLAVNFVAPFFLTLLLMDRMQASGSARIINVVSEEYRVISDFDKAMSNYNAEFGFSWKQYAFSKLALIHFTRELASKMNGSPVTVNAMHPGAVPGNMWKGLPPLLQMRVSLMRWLLPILAPRQILTPEESAKTHIFLAAAPEMEGISGRYYFREREIPFNAIAANDRYARESWRLGVKLSGLDWSGSPISPEFSAVNHQQ